MGRVGRSRWKRRLLLPCLIVALAGSSACSDAPPRGRVLLLGIDGASLRVIEPMLSAGELPALSGIARAGVHGELQSFPPLRSPRVWTSIATGRLPEQHGIETFTVDEGGPAKRLVASFDRQGAALWNILSAAGQRVGVVNWWVTYPPEIVDGVMVSDHFMPEVVNRRSRMMFATRESGAPLVHPAEWVERVERIVEDRRAMDDTRGQFADADLPDWIDPEKLSRWYADDATVGRVARQVSATLRPRLLMVLLKGVDPASHVLWAAMEPGEARADRVFPRAGQREASVEVIRDFYRQSDALLGQLLEDYGPEDLILVVSDHGFELKRRLGGMTGEHAREPAMRAILFARGPGIAPGGPVAGTSIYDIAPSLLRWLGLPVADDMEGRPASFLDIPSGSTTPSYGNLRIERLESRASGNEGEILEHLGALGYFEDEDSED